METGYAATEKWLKASQKGNRAAKNGDWKTAERFYRKAVACSIKLELGMHLYSMLDHAVSLRMLNRAEASIHLAVTVHTLTIEHFDAGQAEFHCLLDLCDLIMDPQASDRLSEIYTRWPRSSLSKRNLEPDRRHYRRGLNSCGSFRQLRRAADLGSV